MTTPVSQQIVRDSFTRANAGTLGANWTSLSDATDTLVLSIVNNAAQAPVGGRAASFWNANTFTANQYSQCIVSGSATGTNNHLVGPIVRASVGGNYYLFAWNMPNAPGILSLQKNINGAFSDIGGTPGTEPAVLGSLLRLEIVGTQLSAYCDGNLIFQVTDSSLSSGAPGISGYMAAASPTAFMTNWEGGNLVWTRKGTVIPIGSAGGSEEPAVLYEANPKILSPNADGKIWKMWFGSGWTTDSIYYAESADGITWTQDSADPVISDGANNVGHGFVMKNGSTYYGFFCTDAQSATNMNRWTSPDGITWTKTNLNILSLGTSGQWDSMGLFNPVVWVQGGTWYMLYNGRSSTAYSIGLATSPDGVTWTKYASNPVIISAGTSAEGKTVVIDGSTYYLWGFTSPTGNLPTDNALWSSPDLHTWTPCPKNPIYQRVLLDEGANLAAGQIGDPVLVELNGTTYMFYDATNAQVAGHFHINLATAPYSLLQLTAMIFGSFIISGNCGSPGATINYSGPASGSVTADSSGNYTIPVLANGTYTITPSGAGFTPASQNGTVTSADIAGVNFTFSADDPTLPYIGCVSLASGDSGGTQFVGHVKVIGAPRAGVPNPYLGNMYVVSAPGGRDDKFLGEVSIVSGPPAGTQGTDSYLGHIAEE